MTKRMDAASDGLRAAIFETYAAMEENDSRDGVEHKLNKRIETRIRAALTEQILREAGLEERVAAAVAAVTKPDATALQNGIRQLFEQQPDAEWRDHITDIAEEFSE